MSYLITDEQYTECFENHVATLKILSEDTQTLQWKEQGTRNCEVNYVFHKNTLFVAGDLGEATFCCTWNPKWDTNDGWLLSIDYLFEKLSAITGNKYTWSDRVAIDDLKESYRDMFEELNDNEFNEFCGCIIKLQRLNNINDKDDLEDLDDSDLPYRDQVDEETLLQFCIVIKHALESSSEEEFCFSLSNDSSFNDFNDFWEWGYHCGRRINPRVYLYLAGLQMAYKQLKERGVE